MKIVIFALTIILPLIFNKPIYAAEVNEGGSDSALSSTLEEFNSDIGLKSELTTINGVISTLLPIMLVLAGLVLLFMLITGGFTMMTSVSDPKAADAGKQRITISLTGFFLLFASYWIIQLLEIILGVKILN